MKESYTMVGAKVGVAMTVILLLLPVIQLMYNAASWIGGFFRSFFGFALTEEVWRLLTYALLIGLCALIGYIIEQMRK